MKKAKTFEILFFISLLTQSSFAAYSNYNSILIGERAAGMGGAYTALTGDPSAGAYYNPATLSRMKGTSLSTTANLYVKSDINYSESGFLDATSRINQGSIQPVPASSGTVHTFGNFAFGISLLLPDHYVYAGHVESTTDTNSFVNINDKSLWVGGSLAMNIGPDESLGLSLYYTARTFARSVTDLDKTNGVLTSEEKEFKQNSLIYIFGYHKTITPNLTLGISHRFESLPINGKGSYVISTISTSGTQNTDSAKDVHAYTLVPAKTTIGLAYKRPKQWTLSADLNFYDSARYLDLGNEAASDNIIYKPTWNLNLGAEYYYKPWLALRTGVYTNTSSHPEVSENPTKREGDHINMLGFSANVAIYTNPNTTVTLGGYYTGGSGSAHEKTGQAIKKVKKSLYSFSFLVGTSFYF